jgi:pilus assembly protein CpaB
MNRSTRTLLVVVLAIGLASAATVGVYRAIARIPVREVEIATAHAVVASHRLPMGTLITRDDVKVVPWPARSPVPGGFTTIEQVANRGVTSSFEENEPVVEAKLADAGAGAGLPPSIPQGMRAISVKVNEVVGVAGFVVPGTNVDVVVTVRTANQDSMSRVVVGNVQVLAAGTRYDQQNAKAGQPIPSTVVTLMVTPADAERIALAAAEGQIILTLRNPLDQEPTVTQGVRTAALMGQAAPQPAVTRVANRVVAVTHEEPPPAAKIYEVEAIKAAKRTSEVIR